jgi:tetratricopeptide (TPR) repeat protein
MKDCPNCGLENEDEAEVCSHCSFEFPAQGALPTLATPTPPQNPLFLPAPAPSDRIRLSLPSSASPPPPPPPPPPASPTAEGQPTDLDQTLVDIEESGEFAIGVIGFATSGKTFFIQRLKRYMKEEGGYEPDPVPAPNEAVVEGTRNIEAHHFQVMALDPARRSARKPGSGHEPREPFYLVDIPGERFRQAVQASLAGGEAETLIKVLRVSHALIIVVAADEMLAPRVTKGQTLERLEIEQQLAELGSAQPGEDPKIAATRKRLQRRMVVLEDKKEVDEHLSELLANISVISAVASELTAPDGTKLTLQHYQSLSQSERSQIYSGPRRGSAPFAFIALAKADLLLMPKAGDRLRKSFPHIADMDRIDIAPASLLKIHRPKFHQRIREAFAWHKIDFVTSFEGQPKNDLRIHYGLDHYGVAAIVDWIHWARDYSRRSGRRTGDAPRFLEKPRAGWDRFEGAVTRRLGHWREQGAVLLPEEVGLNVHRPEPTLWDRVPAMRSRAVNGVMRPGSRWPDAILAGSGLLGLAAILWLGGVFQGSEQRGYAFPLQPVYRAELVRMEEEAPVFGRGIEEQGLRRWTLIPSDGGWFSFRLNNPSRAALVHAMGLIPEQAGGDQLDAATGEEAVASLNQSAGGDPSQIRAANSYHQGLLNYMMGNYPGAAEAFHTASEAVEQVATNPPAGARYDATASRLPAVRIAILNGEGVANLAAGKVEEAAVALRRAKTLADQERNRIVEPKSVDRFWYVIGTRDPVPVVRLPTGDVWSNHLAALIRLHARETDPVKADRLRRELATLVSAAQERAGEAVEHPKLAANLMIAAARSGTLEGLGILDLGDAGEEAASTVTDEVRAITARGDVDVPQARYWKAVARLREALDSRRRNNGANAPARIEETLAANPEEAGALRRWLADVLDTEYGKGSRSVRRQLTANYGQYYGGAAQWRNIDGRAPFGIWWGAILAGLLIVALLIAWRSGRRIRATYLRLFVPQHHYDRQSGKDE